MKNVMIYLVISILLYSCTSNTSEQTVTFNVSGNCNMCKTTIEESVDVEGVKNAEWDKTTKVMTITLDTSKVSVDQLQKNIAAVGYDNDGYRADDAAYDERPECCQYERKPQ